MKKRVVKVYLSKEQVRMLDLICTRLGRDYSGLFEDLLMRYAEDINLVRELVHGRGKETAQV